MGIFEKALPDQNVTRGKNYMFGQCYGFYFVSQYKNVNKQFIETRIHFTGDAQIVHKAMTPIYESLRKEHKHVKQMQVNAFHIMITQQTQSEGKSCVLLEKIVKTITQQLARMEFHSGCELDGCADAVKPYLVNGEVHLYCKTCADKVKNSLENNHQEKIFQKSNVFGGTLGAIIGTVLGCVVWLLIWRLGYISMLVGMLIAFLAMKGYEKLGGAMDIKGMIISLAIALACAYTSFRLGYAWDIFSAYQNEGVDVEFGEIFQNLSSLITELDIKSEYIGNLLKAALFTCGGGIAVAVGCISEARGNYSFKEL